MTDACNRCGSAYVECVFSGYREHLWNATFSLCKSCRHELDRFLAGAHIPGTHGKYDSERGFEIERKTDVGKEDSSPPEA